jgi:hypothetical protein
VPTLRRLVAAAGERLALLTVDLDNPTGYGRIVRDAAGKVVRIVEEKDARRCRARDPRDQHRHPGRADRAPARWLGRWATTTPRASTT